MDTTQFTTVAALLEDPSRWTQGANARSPQGRTVPESPFATQWCLQGAVRRIYGYEAEKAGPPLRRLERVIYEQTCCDYGTTAFNDSRSHAEVLAVCRKADV